MLLLYNLLAAGVAFALITLSQRLFRYKNQRRRRGSDQEAVSFGEKSLSNASTSHEGTSKQPAKARAHDPELVQLKNLYHKLHNLEYNADILPECRETLIALFSETLSEALQASANTILALQNFNPSQLQTFLLDGHNSNTNAYEQYIERRRAGGQREMFGNEEEAHWWLKQSAPVKYVDGAWLGHINKVTTLFALRSVTKNAWQVMSEELGDGDLTKNHIHVYRELLDEIHSGLPEGHMEDFIHPRHELNEKRVWKAAMAQLLISLFPNDFLPETLGFNMAYEGLPLHLMKSVKELDELKINSYYFVLHISIDNNDTGHSAMAMQVVLDYLEHVREEEGEAAAQKMWRRVQAGFVLAEGLPTTPETPTMKRQTPRAAHWTPEAKAVVDIFKKKTSASKIHCNSRLKFGDKTLSEWLDPGAFQNEQWQKDFMDTLGNRKPWVIKGQSTKSKLVLEATWGGRMFGAFTEAEVELLKQWIDNLDQTATFDASTYNNFTQRSSSECCTTSDVIATHPVLNDVPSLGAHLTGISSQDITSVLYPQRRLIGSLQHVDMQSFLPLWFASSSLLENYPNVPVHVSSKVGCAIVRILRAQYGFLEDGDGVAGLDECIRTNDGEAIGLIELGVEMSNRVGLGSPKSLSDVAIAESGPIQNFVLWILNISMRHLEFGDVLFGLTWAFWELREGVGQEEHDLLSRKSKLLLRTIAQQERRNLEIYLDEIRHDYERRRAFCFGVEKGRSAISMVVSCQ